MLLAAVGSLVGGVVGAVGQIQSANAQARALEYNAQVNEVNAKIAERNRIAILDQSDNEAADQVRENRQRMSAIRAAYGASGIDLEGSPLDVLEQTAIENELDIKRIRYAGELQAIGKTDEAAQFRSEAVLNRMGAKDAVRAGRIGAVSALFGGAVNAGTSLARA